MTDLQWIVFIPMAGFLLTFVGVFLKEAWKDRQWWMNRGWRTND